MQYAAVTFWLLVIVFSALGVHRIWCSMIRPLMVNAILLPGTLVAQLGHVLGLLITGGTVNDTALAKDDESGEPQTEADPKPRIPVVGPIVVAMLPLVACAGAIYATAHFLDNPILSSMSDVSVSRSLPTHISEAWSLLRDGVMLAERQSSAVAAGDFGNWRTWLFVYLVVCLTVRMSPIAGNLRGATGAILVLGVITAVIGEISQADPGPVERAWPMITYCVSALLLLLILSLIVKGVVEFVRTLARG